MQNQTLSRLQKSSGIIAAVFKIAAIIMILYGGFYLVAMIVYYVSGGVLFASPVNLLYGLLSPHEASSIGIIGGADGPTAIYVTSRLRLPFLGDIDLTGWFRNMILTVQFAQLVLLIIALFTASGIFRLIQRSHTPFLPQVPQRMKRVAILMLIVSLTGVSAIDGLSLGLMPVKQPVTLLAAGLCFCFALIFDYGCQLQKQDDEML